MAVYEVQGPDGGVYEIEGPDDATEAQISAFAEQRFGTREKSGLEQFGEQANRAIANTVGYPLTVGNDINRLIGLSEAHTYDGGDAVAEGMRALRVPVAERGEKVDTFYERAGRLTGETATFALPAATVARGVAKGAGRVSSFARDMLAAMGRSPKTLVASEAASIAGAAGAGEIAQEATDGKSPVTEMVAEIGGGLLTPYVVAGGALGQGARAIKKPFSTTGSKARASRRVASTVDDVDTARQALVGDTIADLTPAQRVDTAEAFALERSVSDSSPELGKRFARRNAANRELLHAEAQKLGGGDVVATRAYLEGRSDELLASVKQKARSAIDAATTRVQGMQPDARPAQASMAVREELENAYAAGRATESVLWREVPDVPIAPKRTLAVYRDLQLKTPRTEAVDLPNLEKLAPGGLRELESVKELQGLRSQLLQIARNSAADGPAQNRNMARLAGEIADAVLEDLGAVAGKASGPAGVPLRRALDYSRELNQTYRQGNVGRVLGSDRTGADRLGAELTLQGTVGAGKTKGAVAIDDILKAAPGQGTQGAIDDYVRAQVQGLMKPDGSLNVNSAQKWMRQNEDVLNRTPEVRTQLVGAIKAQRSAEHAAGRSTALETSLTSARKSTAARLLNSPVDGEVGTIFGSKNPAQTARQAMALVRRDPEAVAGLRSGVIEHLFTKAHTGKFDSLGNEIISGNRIMKDLMVPKQRAAIVEILGSESAARLEKIARELMKIERSASAAKGQRIIDDTPNKLISILVRGKAATVGGDLGGGTAGGSLRTAGIASSEADNLLRHMTGDKAERMLILAAQDKNLFDSLLANMDTGKGRELVLKKLNLWLSSVAQQHPELFEEEE